mgnify:CR=1 FL=1
MIGIKSESDIYVNIFLCSLRRAERKAKTDEIRRKYGKFSLIL